MGFVRAIRAAILCFLPTAWARKIVNGMGYEISRGARVGLSWVDVNRLRMNDRAFIGHLNRICGDFDLDMDLGGKIGNANLVACAQHCGIGGRSVLKIGKVSGLTSYHFLDMSGSITIGDFSALAGRGSQLWTSLSRYSNPRAGAAPRAITIGENVYVGSMCLILGGVAVADGAVVGGGATVSTDLLRANLYVGSGLRSI